MLKKFFRFLGIFAIVSAVIAAGLVSFDFFQSRGKFPFQTYIGKVNVAGLDQVEAVALLGKANLSAVFSPTVTLEAENFHFTFSPEAIGLHLNLEETVNKAFALSHNDSYLKDLRNRLKNGKIHAPLVVTVDDSQLQAVMSSIAAEINSTSRDASVVFNEQTGGFHIESEELGRDVEVAATIKKIKERLLLGQNTFPIIINYSSPRVSEKALRTFPPVYRLAAYTTYYGRHDSPNRIHNIKLIASWVDGTILMPNEEYSLAAAIGDFTAERGFKEAYVIFGGVLVPQLGGGTCQIGTTLYNALSLADLEIRQRQNHSFYFNIYPLGRDATVYPGQKDLKVKNDTGHPILIKAVATNKRLSFRIYGTPTGKKVTFSAPGVYLLTANGYQPATVRQVLAADRPFKTVIKRTVTAPNGAVLKEELIHSSYKLYGEKTNVPIARPESR